MLLRVFLMLLLCGCATVETKTEVVQRLGEELSAGVGDTVVRLNSEKNLPNAFGKSDLFGRTTPTGVTTLVYSGVFGAKARFLRQDVDIETGATTMNSTPIVIPTTTVTTYSGCRACEYSQGFGVRAPARPDRSRDSQASAGHSGARLPYQGLIRRSWRRSLLDSEVIGGRTRGQVAPLDC